MSCAINKNIPTLLKIIKDLTVKPYVIEGVQAVEYKVYKKVKDTYFIPKFYGLWNINDEEIEITEQPVENVYITFSGGLRKYQEPIAEKVYTHLINYTSGICCLYTGWGKTCIALWLISKLRVKTLIVVHKETLLVQWRERIKFFLNIDAGILRQDTEDTQSPIVVGTVQSIINRNYDTSGFGFLIIDETHHYSTRVFSKLFYKIPAKYSIGLTATLERKDKLEKVIKWFLGKVIVDIQQVKENPTIIIKKFIQDVYPEDKINKVGKLNLPLMITDLCNNILRNIFIVDIIKDLILQNRKILVLSDRRSHCIILNKLLNKENSGLYIGKMSNDELQNSNEKQVIFGTYQMASEGYDNILLDTLILASPKTSIEQSIGRILRQKNHNDPVVIDIVDLFSIFEILYRKRYNFYKKKGYIAGKKEMIEEPEIDFSKCCLVDDET